MYGNPNVQIVLNGAQLAEQLHIHPGRVYEAALTGRVVPDFLDLKSSPIFKAERLTELRAILASNQPEPVA